MMYNTQHLPEHFEQCRLEKTILWHFPYNVNMYSRWIALIQDGRKNHENTYVPESHRKRIMHTPKPKAATPQPICMKRKGPLWYFGTF